MGDGRGQARDTRKEWKTKRDAVRSADKKAMRIAARQWGARTRQQALDAGLTRNQIAYRVQTGQWRQPVRGVFVVVGAPPSSEQRVMISCLAGPADTVASHLSAAALFGLAKPPEVPQVTIPRRASGRFKGADTFRAPRAHARRVAIGRTGGESPGGPVAAEAHRMGFPSGGTPDRVFDGDGKFVARADVGIRELKILFEYDSDAHHGPRFWLADDARRERIEELGWTVVVVDQFDLRPSSTRLKETLDHIVRTRFGGTVPPNRVGAPVPDLRLAS